MRMIGLGIFRVRIRTVVFQILKKILLEDWTYEFGAL
jgi:hypothetical protein